MSIYKPHGNFENEVIDPDKLSRDWQEAKSIIDNATSWQLHGDKTSGLTYSNLGEPGSGVQVLQKQRSGYVHAGMNENQDGGYLQEYGLGIDKHVPWTVPYLKGFKEVWDGSMALEWTSSEPELVLIGYSMWAYRLGSTTENLNNRRLNGTTITDYTQSDWFGTLGIRTRLGLKIDGTIVEGSGPGTNVATNAPEAIVGTGSREKGIVSSSQAVRLIRAGSHRVTPVAGQGPSEIRAGQLTGEYWKGKPMSYSKEGKNPYSGKNYSEENVGVAIVNARVHVIRFPRGKLLGD
tara:strand:- start:15066 stop:15941 length:876 start_codon:yes stop_codon:yes gene_type:complete